MKAAGWMIFLGDMLHNFIDGLTLGAAFMVSISEGLRMSLPIICEEFPHELGDIAILLSSGLTLGQALIMNFLSACSCYVGFILGAKLGSKEIFLINIEKFHFCFSSFVVFSRRTRRISSVDLCLGRWNVHLHWPCWHGEKIKFDETIRIFSFFSGPRISFHGRWNRERLFRNQSASNNGIKT